ncbi:N-acetylglucosamine-6-phosphate deacetylase isoform X3 [Pipistrellus kuhlii]|uniref:N-acetylglucosamine-6-phosphate deacetylase isoform X3 n=1 Tax=Pipistrellus kuhlii TaxID=59472 RepID=UPI00174F17EE|nr:N-acetylglucosamine-6-phosphate deacetylase isoform X3 [Pipistrellus kuhlii]
MRGGEGASRAPVLQLTNCRILRGRRLLREDLWVREGRILDPEKLFFEERLLADQRRDCGGCILAPGFIDVQINGGFGVDFSQATEDVGSGVALVAQRILSHGVTSFCPTLVTSPPEVYHKVLPQIPVKSGGPHGAGVLGVHLEGPFISREKRGAHPEAYLRSFEANAFHDVLATYGSLDNVRIVTLAPELGRSREVIRALTARGICVSLGHSVADLQVAEEAVQSGATFITHLFNAMLPFHHRDPGIVGLLTSDRLPPGRHIFYGMISDGIHTNPAALRIAHRAHPQEEPLGPSGGVPEPGCPHTPSSVPGGPYPPPPQSLPSLLSRHQDPVRQHSSDGRVHPAFPAGHRLQCGVSPGGCVAAPRPATGTGEAQGHPGLRG